MPRAGESATVYRVRSAGSDRWEVFREPIAKPVAAFRDRNAALTYALRLARGRISLAPLLASLGREEVTCASVRCT